MSNSEHLVTRLPNDVGGQNSGPFARTDRALEQWERHCHALADVLDFHKIISTEEKRRGVEALGRELVGNLSYYERWAIAFANLLFAKRILTPEEFARKMGEIETRAPAT
jgi:Nitrile hydratase beta subunit